MQRQSAAAAAAVKEGASIYKTWEKNNIQEEMINIYEFETMLLE